MNESDPRRCAQCTYDMTGIRPGDPCPECGWGASEPDGLCFGCGYDLDGLPDTGVCPECSVPVVQSRRGNFLRYASAEYLGRLHLGIFCVLAAILVQLLLVIFGVIAGIGAGIAGVSPALINLVSAIVGLPVTAVLLYGWWLFTERDVSSRRELDAITSRKVLRTAVIAQAAVAAVSLVIQVSGPSVGYPLVLFLIVGFGGMVSFAVQYFASMLYVRRVALRIPDNWVFRRAKLLMWLGPLLYIVGAIVLMIGPLIALILYWNMLDRVRKGIKAARAEHAAA